MTIQETEKAYFQYLKKIMDFNEAIALAEWDMRTGAPKKGIPQRSEVVGTLAGEVFERQTSSEMKAYLDALTDRSVQDELSERTKRTVEKSKKEFERLANVPAAEHKEYVILQSKAQSVWEDAKASADFAALQPYLEKIVMFKRRFAGYWGAGANNYDALLDLYEPGMTTETLDRVFGRLREGIVPLAKEIAAAGDKPNADFLSVPVPVQKQKAFSLHILREMGYDFAAGRLDETLHPFETALNPDDVRVTTHYVENDFISALLGTMHEGGHALYEQHISRDLVGTPLCAGTSMGIHESQSLFFENFVGRSRAFWERHFDALKAYGSGQFDKVSIDDFYRAINISKPSLIRIDADELTYPLHIMVRYDIEKGLFNGDIEVKDLPGVWNEKMAHYLGIRPKNDREGVLQDIHWPSGDFGYFPSYALGYLYAAQFKNAMLNDLPDFDDLLRTGDIQSIREWLTVHIHQYGSLKKPLTILHEATGEDLNADYFIHYLETKYRGVYHLDK